MRTTTFVTYAVGQSTFFVGAFLSSFGGGANDFILRAMASRCVVFSAKPFRQHYGCILKRASATLGEVEAHRSMLDKCGGVGG
jgi:hypothetical protein